MYKRYLSIPDTSVVLDSIWRGLELAYGYRETDSMTKIYECSNGPVVENSTQGLKVLQQDLIYCMGKVGRTEAASLDNPALVNNFIKRLPQKFRSQYHFQALNIDSTRKFDDLLKYLTRSIRATEHNPEVWVEITDNSKRTNNNINRGRFTKTDNQRSSSNHVESNNETVSADKVDKTTYAPTASGKPDVSNYVCTYCRSIGHAMWCCEKYLELNLERRVEYAKRMLLAPTV